MDGLRRFPYLAGLLNRMTKSAIAGLTRGLAHELGPKGITINSVDPGPTRTEMSRGAREGEIGDRLRSMLATGRVGEPEEVAAMRFKWDELIAGDPYYSPNLTRNDEDYSLRTRA